MLKRSAILLLSSALLGLVSSQAAMAKPVTLTYWGTWSGIYREIEKGIIDQFNKEHEGKIFVKGVEMADVETKILTAVAGGVAPDCFKLDRFRVGSYAAKNVLLNLDPYIKRDKIDPNSFFKATWNENVYGGKVYGLPWNTDDRGFYYNKTMFKQLGLDPENPPRTWEDVKLMSNKIDLLQGDKWQRVGFIPHNGNWYFLGWLWAAGGEMTDDSGKKVTWNSPAGLKAAEFEVDAVEKYGGTAKLGSFGDFLSGKVGAVMDGSWFLGNIRQIKKKKFEHGVGVPPRPAGLEKDKVTWAGGFSICIPRGSKHPQEAFTFIKYYTMAKEAQLALGMKSGQIPALKAAAYDEKFLNSDPMMRKFVDLMPEARYRTVLPSGSELWSIYTDQLTPMLVNGKKSPKAALDTTAADAQKILDRAWSRVRNK